MLEPDNQRPPEYQVIHAGWMAEFEPEGYQEERLVEILIHNDWTLKLAERRLMQTEEALLDHWTPERQKDFDAQLRSKATAERCFYRAWSVLRGLQKDILRREIAIIRLNGKIAELEANKGVLNETGESGQPGTSHSTESSSLHSLHKFCAVNMQSGACSKHEAGDVRTLSVCVAGLRKNFV